MTEDPSTDGGAPAAETVPEQLTVTLRKGDFLYFNWVLALERPILPFFVYGFVLFNLASLLGIWPAGRVFALAILVPAAGYCVWLVTTANGLWRRFPSLAKPRSYRFGEESYGLRVQGEGEEEEVAYGDVLQVLESRRGFYLARRSGNHDLLPRRVFLDAEGFGQFLQQKVGRHKRSTFL